MLDGDRAKVVAPPSVPCFEAWMGRPFEHGEEYFQLFVQVPIERG